MSTRCVWSLVLLGVVLLTPPASAQNMVVNGEFDQALTDWTAGDYEDAPSMVVSVDKTSQISGTHSAKIVITQAGTAEWQLRFRQLFNLSRHRVYDIAFQAKVSSAVSVKCGLKQVGPPHGMFAQKTFVLGTLSKTFTLRGIMPRDHQVALAFFLGDMAVGTTIWIDDVVMTESEVKMPERLSNTEDGTVLVDLAENLAPATFRGSGSLFGFSGAYPADRWVKPLKYRTYRTVEYRWSIFQSGLYRRLQDLGVLRWPRFFGQQTGWIKV